MTKSTSKRGGYRPGSGRPPLPPELRRVRRFVYVKPATDKTIRELKTAGKLDGRELGKVIDDYIDSLQDKPREVIINGHKLVMKDGALTFVDAPVKEAAAKYIASYYHTHHNTEPDMTSLFLAGAEWQKEQKPAQTSEEKEYIRTIKGIIADFIRDKKPEDVAFYQKIYDWLDGRHIEQKPNIELIQRSWYMEGYQDRKFSKEPKWIIKTGEGGPEYEENSKYGQMLKEQKPTEWSEEVDLEKELDKYLRGEFKQTAGGNFNNYIQVARHFYELGKSRKEE